MVEERLLKIVGRPRDFDQRANLGRAYPEEHGDVAPATAANRDEPCTAGDGSRFERGLDERERIFGAAFTLVVRVSVGKPALLLEAKLLSPKRGKQGHELPVECAYLARDFEDHLHPEAREVDGDRERSCLVLSGWNDDHAVVAVFTDQVRNHTHRVAALKDIRGFFAKARRRRLFAEPGLRHRVELFRARGCKECREVDAPGAQRLAERRIRCAVATAAGEQGRDENV